MTRKDKSPDTDFRRGYVAAWAHVLGVLLVSFTLTSIMVVWASQNRPAWDMLSYRIRMALVHLHVIKNPWQDQER